MRKIICYLSPGGAGLSGSVPISTRPLSRMTSCAFTWLDKANRQSSAARKHLFFIIQNFKSNNKGYLFYNVFIFRLLILMSILGFRLGYQ